jgi:hypothetical protein
MLPDITVSCENNLKQELKNLKNLGKLIFHVSANSGNVKSVIGLKLGWTNSLCVLNTSVIPLVL